MNIELILFWVFAVLTVGSSVGVVWARNAIHSAMSLVATFFFLSGIYVLLWAHTIAVLQVLVYAGAIMVLFLFVIMLLSIGNETGPTLQFNGSRIVGALTAMGLLAALVVATVKWPVEQGAAFDVEKFGTLQVIGDHVYKLYLLPFEAVSVLLLVAIVGSVVVAKSRI